MSTSPRTHELDLLIIGAGPVGLYAAYYAGAVVCGVVLAAISDLVFSLVTGAALLVATGLLLVGGTFGGPTDRRARIH